jgi:hypothetical protein
MAQDTAAGDGEEDLPQGLTRYLKVRMTDAEWAELKDFSRSANRSMSEVARRRIAGLKAPPPPVPAVNLQLKAELGRQGVNLNQIAEHLNRSRGQFADHVRAGLADYMKSIGQLLKNVQKQLIGMPSDTTEEKR